MSGYRARAQSFLIKGLVLSTTLGAWLLLLPTAYTEAAIRSVAVGTSTLTPTPAFRNGGNTIVVIGTDIGLTLASAFEVHATCALGSPRIAIGSITRRDKVLVDRIGIPTGKLTLNLPLTPTGFFGQACGIIKYPAAPPDTFPMTIFRRGTVTGITATQPGANTALTTVAAGTPVNLTFTGNFMSPNTASNNAILLPYIPGAVATRTPTTFRISVRFKCPGGPKTLYPGLIFDGNAPSGIISADASKRYQGGARLNVTVTGCTTSNQRTTRPPVTGGSSSGTQFVDVAPRANMLNVFRRLSTTAAFTRGGAQYYRIDSERWCRGMSGNQSQIITVPNPIWGVSNVGTIAINTAFASQLRRGTQILATRNVMTLNPGQTVNFTYQRPNSRVRVRTFTDRNGCFVSPTSDAYFEDPRYTVVVNTNGAVQEATTNQPNNTRSY